MFQILYQPILNALILFYNLLFSNLGLAIIALTGAIKLLLVPLTTPQLKSTQKLQEINPELEKLKKKYKDDKQKLAQAQMELYRKHGLNPAAGCLPQVLQIFILLSLYQVFNQVIKPGAEVATKISQSLYPFVSKPTSLNLNFLYLDLAKPDLIQIPGLIAVPGVFVILAAVLQFISSKMMSPLVKTEEKIAKKTEEKGDDMAAAMQKQMLYIFPIMTLIFGYTMPSGVILYWFAFSLFSFIHQLVISKKEIFNFLQVKKKEN